MKNKIKDKINDFIEANTVESANEVLDSLLTNRQQTQNKVIYYRKTFLIAASIYFMIVLGIFDPSIIGIKFNDIGSHSRPFGFNNLLEFIILMAPITFSLLYYITVLSLIHRSVLNIAINKIQKRKYKKEAILHYLNFPFSSGLLIGLLSNVNNNSLISWFRKNSKQMEYLIYVFVVFHTTYILISRIIAAHGNHPIVAIISIFLASAILINAWRTLYNYRKNKNASK